MKVSGRRAALKFGPPVPGSESIWKPLRSQTAARGSRPAAFAACVRRDNILWVLLGVALLYFLVHDFERTFDDVKTGLSNGTIWALIALGYTLVYGIIELINFAHGEVFMIGSFVSRVAVRDARHDRHDGIAAADPRASSPCCSSRCSRAARST